MDAILEFNMFLLSEKAYKPFMANRRIRDLALLKDTNPIRYVESAFLWARAKEGEEYWIDINNKWVSHYSILRTLELLRETCDDIEYIFTNGGCYKLYEIIKLHHPLAKAWYDGVIGHIYTQVNERFYDIRGEHQFCESWYLLESEPDILKDAKSWKCDNLPTRKKIEQNDEII